MKVELHRVKCGVHLAIS